MSEAFGADTASAAVSTTHNAMPYRKGYVDTPTGQVHYRIYGEGAPLVLLHGTPESSLQFQPIVPSLAAAGFRTISVDTPGFGMSDLPAEPPTIATYAGNLVYLFDELGIADAAILGHHTGSAIACEFAIAQPERVTKLIFNGPPIFSADARRQMLDKLSDAPLQRTRDGAYLGALMTMRSGFTPSQDLEALERSVIWRLVAGDRQWYGANAVFRYDMEGQLARLATPTLLLTHTNDPIHSLSVHGHALRPDFPLESVERGSWDMFDGSEDFIEAMLRFLRA